MASTDPIFAVARCDDEVAGQRKLESATDAHAVDGSDHGQWERFELIEELRRRRGEAFSVGHCCFEERDVGSGREVAKSAAEENGARAFLFGSSEAAEHAVHERRTQQVVWRMLHRENREGTVVLDDDRISGHVGSFCSGWLVQTMRRSVLRSFIVLSV